MRLADKVAIVTGGASGMGLETVMRFAAEGAKVVIADFNEETGAAENSADPASGLPGVLHRRAKSDNWAAPHRDRAEVNFSR